MLFQPKAPDTARKKEEWDRLQKASAMFADVCARPGGSNNPISVSSSSCKGKISIFSTFVILVRFFLIFSGSIINSRMFSRATFLSLRR